MYILLMIVHVIVCVFLIIVVLLQSGKAADLAGAFGGMGSQTAFGPRGSATLLSKATTVSAALFMITSLSLSILATRNAGTGGTVLERQQAPKSAPATKNAPAMPAPAVPAPSGAPGVPAGQPSVTLTPENGGPSKTIPLKIDPSGKVTPMPAQPAPAPASKKK
ncbi:MAG TPA: preprotein translocase subunit SecG [Bryobacteraceae bacterium]|nr:preprotein translocase subunit SecG [Bryobacteraceae bacterium]